MELPFTSISTYYDRLVDRYGHDPRACDYGRAASQLIKFKVLAAVLDLREKSVLDVGCGFADFAVHLREGHPGVKYTGIDLSPRMIAEAQRSNPGLDLRVGNILDQKDGTFDVVTANGIFYLLGAHAPKLMRSIIQKMYHLAQTAVAFNSLSSWATDQEEGEYYADPLATVEYCRTLTPWVVLRHDYHPRDFTVYLYKKGGA
jgi:SAM-dependent methyltransferase